MQPNVTILDVLIAKINEKIVEGKDKTNKISKFPYSGEWTHPLCNDMSILGPTGLEEKNGFYALSSGAQLLVDRALIKPFATFMSFENSEKTGEWKYEVYKTKDAGMSDYQIIGNFDITELTNIETILACANHLIKADMEDSGPMFSISKDDQENLNLGYYEGEYKKLKMVFLERKKPVNGEPREYHIHESDVPRDFYKKDRYFLIPIK